MPRKRARATRSLSAEDAFRVKLWHRFKHNGFERAAGEIEEDVMAMTDTLRRNACLNAMHRKPPKGVLEGFPDPEKLAATPRRKSLLGDIWRTT